MSCTYQRSRWAAHHADRSGPVIWAVYTRCTDTCHPVGGSWSHPQSSAASESNALKFNCVSLYPVFFFQFEMTFFVALLYYSFEQKRLTYLDKKNPRGTVDRAAIFHLQITKQYTPAFFEISSLICKAKPYQMFKIDRF